MTFADDMRAKAQQGDDIAGQIYEWVVRETLEWIKSGIEHSVTSTGQMSGVMRLREDQYIKRDTPNGDMFKHYLDWGLADPRWTFSRDESLYYVKLNLISEEKNPRFLGHNEFRYAWTKEGEATMCKLIALAAPQGIKIRSGVLSDDNTAVKPLPRDYVTKHPNLGIKWELA